MSFSAVVCFVRLYAMPLTRADTFHTLTQTDDSAAAQRSGLAEIQRFPRGAGYPWWMMYMPGQVRSSVLTGQCIRFSDLFTRTSFSVGLPELGLYEVVNTGAALLPVTTTCGPAADAAEFCGCSSFSVFPSAVSLCNIC